MNGHISSTMISPFAALLFGLSIVVVSVFALLTVYPTVALWFVTGLIFGFVVHTIPQTGIGRKV